MSKAAADTLQKVAAEFEADVLSDLQAGKEQALQNVQAVRRETAQAVAKTIEGGERQAESVKRQIIGAAELEVRNAQLRSLETTVNEVFDSAVRKVSSLSDSALEGSLTFLIKEGMDVIGPRAVVHCSANQRKAVSGAVRKLNKGPVKLTVDEKGIETIGGVVLATSNGSMKFDNTYEARLERMRQTLRKEVAGILTGS
ncbi:MAG TPA: V-type ATP synthase subunit E family protein [Nitrososphaerales archaeon]|nr:V-type ATP synthase subunit E family protein [Nitrososphaerales archaeon]